MNFKDFARPLVLRLIELKRLYFSSFPFRRYAIKNQCIFIHIPKTAGTSILKVLVGEKIIPRDHLSYITYLQANRLAFERYFKFTFVRNPYDRIVSCFEYLINGGNQAKDKYYEHLLNKDYYTFEKFVLEFLNKDRIHEEILFKPQYLFIYDHAGECKVDFVGRFENLENDYRIVMEKLNINQQLPFINKSRRNKIDRYYQNEAVKKKIQFLYKKDFEYFDYRI